MISIMWVLLEKRALGLAHNVDVDVARGRIDRLSIDGDIDAAHVLGLLTHDEAHLLAETAELLHQVRLVDLRPHVSKHARQVLS